MEGLEKFREAFGEHTDNYVIIGGTACELVFEGTPVRSRATHDIDMVIIVETMTPDFGTRFWQFVREAGYRLEKRQTKDGEPQKYGFYRFMDGKDGYPKMIELLSRHPDALGEPSGLVIEPIPMDEYISNLSAIILDDDLYSFTIEHSRVTDGIRHADSAALIALKSKAYTNLLSARQKGTQVNGRDIRKHRSDVLKSALVSENLTIEAPASIVTDVREFVSSLRTDWTTMVSSLAKSLDRDENFIAALLTQLEGMFVC